MEEQELQDIVAKILEITRNSDGFEPLFINEAMEAKRTMAIMVASLQRIKYSSLH